MATDTARPSFGSGTNPLLLGRESALATMRDGLVAAAHGRGAIALVTGEAGIGKTALVARFVRDLPPDARVLVGTSDDLSIPRPLGPIRDLAPAVSPALAAALSADAAPHEIHSLLLAELDLPPGPTVLVLEDVHWADEATLDAITVLGRRIASLPALLVLTFRGGEAPPGHPLHATLGAIPARDALVLELAPLSQGAVASLAGDAADEVYAVTGGNPFYVGELLAFRSVGGLPRSVATAVVGRASLGRVSSAYSFHALAIRSLTYARQQGMNQSNIQINCFRQLMFGDALVRCVCIQNRTRADEQRRAPVR